MGFMRQVYVVLFDCGGVFDFRRQLLVEAGWFREGPVSEGRVALGML